MKDNVDNTFTVFSLFWQKKAKKNNLDMEPILRRDGQSFFRIFIEKEKNFDMEHIVENLDNTCQNFPAKEITLTWKTLKDNLDNTLTIFPGKRNDLDVEHIERQSRQYTYSIF